ncbi:helix-turn-helix domain-containing protein [Streptomyces kaempferi]
MTEENVGFGALLRQLRLEASLTIEALAEASGVSGRGIGNLERGRRATPQRGTVAALANGLNLREAERERLLAAARIGRNPRQSPADVRAFPRGIDDFVGREQELAQLAALAGQASLGRSQVVAVSGPPGTGKTTLALHAARELADRFPDGQLVLDLRGMDDEPPMPAELTLRVLKAVGVADRDLAKAGPQGHPELYRQALAGRRCLLVLDNARDEAQVRPLLPSAGGTMVLITSRRMLTGLEDVERLPIGELTLRSRRLPDRRDRQGPRGHGSRRTFRGRSAMRVPSSCPASGGQLAGDAHWLDRTPPGRSSGSSRTSSGRPGRR